MSAPVRGAPPAGLEPATLRVKIDKSRRDPPLPDTAAYLRRRRSSVSCGRPSDRVIS
jgi:hypothetical protein